MRSAQLAAETFAEYGGRQTVLAGITVFLGLLHAGLRHAQQTGGPIMLEADIDDAQAMVAAVEGYLADRGVSVPSPPAAPPRFAAALRLVPPGS